MGKSLIKEIEGFMDRHGIEPTPFGTKAVKDPHFMGKLKAKHNFRRSTLKRVRDFMARVDADPSELERA